MASQKEPDNEGGDSSEGLFILVKETFAVQSQLWIWYALEGLASRYSWRTDSYAIHTEIRIEILIKVLQDKPEVFPKIEKQL